MKASARNDSKPRTEAHSVGRRLSRLRELVPKVLVTVSKRDRVKSKYNVRSEWYAVGPAWLIIEFAKTYPNGRVRSCDGDCDDDDELGDD